MNRYIDLFLDGLSGEHRPALRVIHWAEASARIFLYALAQVNGRHARLFEYLGNFDTSGQLATARDPFIHRISHQDGEIIPAFLLDLDHIPRRIRPSPGFPNTFLYTINSPFL